MHTRPRRGVPTHRAAGGAPLERDTQGLDAAAATIDDFQQQVIERLDELDAGLEDLIDRVEAIEAGSGRPEPGVR